MPVISRYRWFIQIWQNFTSLEFAATKAPHRGYVEDVRAGGRQTALSSPQQHSDPFSRSMFKYLRTVPAPFFADAVPRENTVISIRYRNEYVAHMQQNEAVAPKNARIFPVATGQAA